MVTTILILGFACAKPVPLNLAQDSAVQDASSSPDFSPPTLQVPSSLVWL